MTRAKADAQGLDADELKGLGIHDGGAGRGGLATVERNPLGGTP